MWIVCGLWVWITYLLTIGPKMTFSEMIFIEILVNRTGTKWENVPKQMIGGHDKNKRKARSVRHKA